jgi:hypothetical protein
MKVPLISFTDGLLSLLKRNYGPFMCLEVDLTD